MSVGFRAVQWNRDKLVYDGILLAAVALYIGGFAAIYWRLYPPKNLPDAIDIWIRAFGTCAFLMLTVILSIGPLARLNPPLPAVAVQPAPFRGADVRRRGAACLVHAGLVHGAGQFAEPRRGTDDVGGLRQVHRLPLQGAWLARLAGPVPDGRHQP